jgi:hypothetical protein
MESQATIEFTSTAGFDVCFLEPANDVGVYWVATGQEDSDYLDEGGKALVIASFTVTMSDEPKRQHL